MSSKEQRSVVQVRALLSALGWLNRARVGSDIPPRPDVFVEIDSRRIAIETTEYHGDEMRHGGSGVRRREQQDAAAGRIRAYAVAADPLHGLIARIQAKVSKQYGLSGTDESWLAIFAGVPQSGAAAATFFFATFLKCQQLTTCATPLLETSMFARCYIFCELTERGTPTLFAWEKRCPWIEVKLPGQGTVALPSSPLWDIQKLFRER